MNRNENNTEAEGMLDARLRLYLDTPDRRTANISNARSVAVSDVSVDIESCSSELSKWWSSWNRGDIVDVVVPSCDTITVHLADKTMATFFSAHKVRYDIV